MELLDLILVVSTLLVAAVLVELLNLRLLDLVVLVEVVLVDLIQEIQQHREQQILVVEVVDLRQETLIP
jgi:hypothetical protein